ncbi:GNAT family N-acetyltransferase [Paraferrimonas sp. SM1919]|uniref:GNAT family N-acetyltransferase n=1 Tax=Paraferrimonas sp. SM1919 TaxID=2662263 RepID=UPI0013D174ED|nr:N-acetyltransferase [Paraferrimonas sp. SM1919]
MTILFKAYQPQQTQEIISLFTDTFSNSEGKDAGEAINALVTKQFAQCSNEQLQCYIATAGDTIIAAINLSSLMFTASGIKAKLLSPVAVSSSYQRQGLGRQLIEFAKNELKQQGIELLVTYGDPNYYGKVGFQAVTTEQIPAPQPLSMPFGWIAQTLDGSQIPTIGGQSTCIEPLMDASYW